MIYVAYNMHWNRHAFALPRLEEGMCWYEVADTGKKEGFRKSGEEIEGGRPVYHRRTADYPSFDRKAGRDSMNPWGHFKTITKHKILVMKYCFRIGLYRQGLLTICQNMRPRNFWWEQNIIKGD